MDSQSAALTDFHGPHKACRNAAYPRTEGSVKRAPVADDEVPWTAPLPSYQPTVYTNPGIRGQPWADGEVGDAPLAFNALDGKVNRASFVGRYSLDGEGRPVNPMGRTGLAGRGTLGRWGPNHAADPIVTRWQRCADGSKAVDASSGRPLLEFVAIQRRDCGEWALPGGMVDPGEEVSATLRREFGEETMSSLAMADAERKDLEARMAEFFQHGELIYRGYVDDPRNTDNAWMETVAVNFHDDQGTAAAKFSLQAGDDAVGVRWMAAAASQRLYASHAHLLRAVAQRRDAHW